MKKTNETGRSMVEMLGVLAIIGVLSVGGIMGYTRAMRAWRSSEVIEACNRLIVVGEVESTDGSAQTYNATLGITDANKGVATIAGGIVSQITLYPFNYAGSETAGTVKIDWKANYDPEQIQRDIADKLSESDGKLSGYTLEYGGSTGTNTGTDTSTGTGTGG